MTDQDTTSKNTPAKTGVPSADPASQAVVDGAHPKSKLKTTVKKVAAATKDIAEFAGLIAINLGPEAAKFFGPIGYSSGILFTDVEQGVQGELANRKLHAYLDANEKNPASADVKFSVINATTSLGASARSKDVDAALKVINALEADTDKREDGLAEKLEDLEGRRSKARAVLGLPPEPEEKAPSYTNPADVKDFAVHDARIGGREIRAIESYAEQLAKNGEKPDPDFWPVRDERNQMNGATGAMSDHDRKAYEDRFITHVENDWEHASIQDKKLVDLILQDRSIEVLKDKNRLDMAEVQLTGYPKTPTVSDPTPPEPVWIGSIQYKPDDTYAREVERIEAAAMAAHPEAYKPLDTPQGPAIPVTQKGKAL